MPRPNWGAVRGVVMLTVLSSSFGSGGARGPCSLVVPAGLGPVSADAHDAPAARPVARGVEEEPPAARTPALADGRELGRRQQVGRRPRDRPEHGVQSPAALLPDPREAALGGYHLGAGHRAAEFGVQRLERG